MLNHENAELIKSILAIDRLSAVAGQLSSPKQGKEKLLEKNPDDVRLRPSLRLWFPIVSAELVANRMPFTRLL